MKRTCQKGLAILLALCMVLTFIPGIMPHAKADGVTKRTTTLDLTASNVTYSGGAGSADPNNANIVDTAEGWSWYNDTNYGYAANTLVLDGIDLETGNAIAIKLPSFSTIVLADNSVNTVTSQFSNTGATYGINCVGALTIKGTGALYVTSGTPSNSYSIAVSSAGNLTVEDGTIVATGGTAMTDSIGLNSSTGSITISGGNVTAVGGSVSFGSSNGIYAYSTVAFTGGTIYAKSVSDDNAMAVLAPSGLIDTGMTVLQKDEESNYTVEVTKGFVEYYYTYLYNTYYDTTDIRITEGVIAGATVSNKTVSGMTGTALSGTDTITLTLTNCTFKSLAVGDNVSSWFSNLPGNISVTVSSITANTAELTFSGTPAAASNAVMAITIPAGKLSTNSNLAVAANSNAKFDIIQSMQRTTILNLSAAYVNYNTSGGPASEDPATTDITDTTEGWSWNSATKTLTLDGIDLETSDTIAIQLPADSTIALADDSVNTVKSNTGESLGGYGIYCPGALTVQSVTGVLNVSNSASNTASVALAAAGNLTISGGTIVAEGGQATDSSMGIFTGGLLRISAGSIEASAGDAANSYGILSLNSVAVTGGNVRAESGTATEGSYGIGANTITFSGGTIYAKSGSNPESFAVYAELGITDTGMSAFQLGTSDYTVAVTKLGNSYVYNSDTIATDIKLEKTVVPSATVSDKKVSSMVNTALSGNDTVTVTLTDCTFTNLSEGDAVSGWFSNLPLGIAVRVSNVTANTAELKFSGTPNAASRAAMLITIPRGKLGIGYDLTVTSNSNAKFDITYKRTTALDLTASSLLYYTNIGINDGNPTRNNITDTAEGWSWYKTASGSYAANTLVLDGITLEPEAVTALTLPANSTIVLVDGSENTVKSTYYGSLISYGIYGAGALTVQGDTGMLNVTNNAFSSNSCAAFTAEGSLNISGGSITVKAGRSNGSSIGLYVAGSVNISGGNTTATGDTATSSYGIYSLNAVTVTGGTVTATGGAAGSGSYGIFTYATATFSGGMVYAKSGLAAMTHAIYAYSSISDTGMTVFQKDGDADYTVAATKSGIHYVYNTNTPATDIKIFQMPASFSGSGTELDPYLISSAAQLKEMSYRVNNQNDLFGNKYYKLTNDIVLNTDMSSAEEWSPIGTGYSAPFAGVFDGNGHTISGLYINGTSVYSGLFGYVRRGTVKNAGLIGGQVASTNSLAFAGGIVGFHSGGVIENCYNTGTVSGKYVGGIVGTNSNGHIENCYNTGAISGSGSNCAAGGIAGQNSDAAMTIVNCYNTGSVTVTVSDTYVGHGGGIAGSNTEASIRNCYSTGVLTGNETDDAVAYMGGIAGSSIPGGEDTIENSYWLEGTAHYGIAENAENTGCTSKTDAEMTAAAFVTTLNRNVVALNDTYATLFPWKADTDSENGGYPVFDAVPAGFTLAITGGGTGATAGGSYAAGAVVSISAGTKAGYTFSGWTSAGGGSFADARLADTTFIMPGANVTITANWTATNSNNGGSNPTSGGTSGTGGTNVIINGEFKSAGTTKTETGSDGRIVTTVTVDSDKLEAILASERNGATVTIPVMSGADKAVGTLTGKMVRSMEDKDATLIIQTGSSSYTLPASQININAVSQQFGANVTLTDIAVSVSISNPSGTMAKVVENAEKDGSFTIVAPSVDFTITCTYGGKTVNVSHFNAYVERMIAIPDGVDPSKITTGIVVEPDGTVHHVPTRVTVIDGKYYAIINSLTNSTYSIIWNPMEFPDVANHWAKDPINNMGSRMVITGGVNGNYDPEREITRAEFAAIVVRALGLEPGTGSISFSDVDTSDWYYGYIETAVSYGIIKGYTKDTFGPDDMITREQAMTMITRAMKITGLNANLTESDISKLIGTYTDGATVSDYAKDSVAACLKTAIVNGRVGKVLAPTAKVTRAEAAVMMERLLHNSDLI